MLTCVSHRYSEILDYHNVDASTTGDLDQGAVASGI